MWVVDMENMVDGTEPRATLQKWPKRSIFRVPPHLKAGNDDVVFKPQRVALGPFHREDAALQSMEEHKLRAVQHLAAAVESVAADLEDAYAELGDEWRGKNRGRFLQMMIADGCFLLELMRNHTSEKIPGDYSPNDPVFGLYSVQHTAVFVHRDMLLIENQLPLIILRTIVAVESGQTPIDASINKLVLQFLYPQSPYVVGSRLGLHPLDLYHRSLLRRRSSEEQPNAPHRCWQLIFCCLPTIGDNAAAEPYAPKDDDDDEPDEAAPRSAHKLYEAGIWFKRRKKGGFLDDIDIWLNTLEMPRVLLDDSSECKYRNLMAFEALHAGAGGNDVTAFVLFMRDLVDSTADVELLRKKGILRRKLAGGDQAVVSLFNRLAVDVDKIDRSRLCAIRRDMDRYMDYKCWPLWCTFIYKSWVNFRTTHLSSIWTFIALLAGIAFLCCDIVQTVYSVKSYYKNDIGGPPPPPPPSHSG